MTVILDGKRIVGQVLKANEDGTAVVLMRGGVTQLVVLAECQTAFIGMD